MTAELGKPAPDFKLKDLNGAEVSLSSFKGKVVVLEWFNPGCPYVKAAHGEGALKDMAKKNPEVVWLAINSNAPGKEGHGLEANKEGAKGFGMEHPVLLDEDGKVGKLYGAQRTPHMYVVDKDGNLAYRGALDNSGSGIPKDANPYVNHIEDALKNLAEGKPVATPDTKAWGCSVKYGG
jgi:peroxiredoxin